MQSIEGKTRKVNVLIQKKYKKINFMVKNNKKVFDKASDGYYNQCIKYKMESMCKRFHIKNE